MRGTLLKKGYNYPSEALNHFKLLSLHSERLSRIEDISMAGILPFDIDKSTVKHILTIKSWNYDKNLKIHHLWFSDQPDAITTHLPWRLDNPDAARTPPHLSTSSWLSLTSTVGVKMTKCKLDWFLQNNQLDMKCPEIDWHENQFTISWYWFLIS